MLDRIFQSELAALALVFSFVLLLSSTAVLANGNPPRAQVPDQGTAAPQGSAGSATATVTVEVKDAPATKIDPVFFGLFREGAPKDMGFIDKFAKDYKFQPAQVMWYLDYSFDFPAADCAKVAKSGAIPHLVWEPWFWGADEDDQISLFDINKGKYDAYIKKFAQQAKKYGQPVFIRWGHEFNIEGYPWGISNNGCDPEIYIKAYRRVHDFFTAAGAGNVKWIWCFMNYSYPEDWWNDYVNAYPGDDYVDWIGIDGYNWGNVQSWSQWQSFKILFRLPSRRIAKLHPTKPIMVAEFGSTEKGGNKAEWINEIIPELETGSRYIRAINWFDINKETNWKIDSSPESKKAFAKMIANPLFSSSAQDLWNATAYQAVQERKTCQIVKAAAPPKIDGTLTGWNTSYPVTLDSGDLVQEGSVWKGPQDISGSFYFMWDEKNLYIACSVTDNDPLANIQDGENIWNGDALEVALTIDPKANPERTTYTKKDFQIGLGTGDGQKKQPSIWNWNPNYDAVKAGAIVVKKTATGYILTAKLPWSYFGEFVPQAGTSIGFNMALDDGAASGERTTQLVWNGDYFFYKDPSVWGIAKFVDK